MREIKQLIVHCSYTPPGMDIGAASIRRWHVQGNGWSDIGYHYIIRRDGTVEEGRPVENQGAHCLGQNSDSIGICLIGGMSEKGYGYLPEFNFTGAQMFFLGSLVEKLLNRYELDKSDCHGHNEYSNKECPCFCVQEYFSG